MPSAWLLTRAPVKARSVPFSRRMWNCSGVRRERHSASLNSTLREAAWLSFATAAALKGPAAGISGIVDLLCFHYDADEREEVQRCLFAGLPQRCRRRFGLRTICPGYK